MNISPDDWKTVSKLFDDLLDLPDNARQRWLDTLPDQYLVYRHTLQSLLASHAKIQTSDFLNTIAGADPNHTAAIEASLKPGTVIGAYVIEEQIGRGGMGTVWRAHRADGLIKRPVAIKLPYAALFVEGMAQRFVLERDILAQLTHPNIAHLYDAGTTENGQPFLALEYVQGVSLTEYCNTQQQDIRQRLQLALQMLEAVRYAHSHLVIHRDLKPSNILVTSEGQLRLLDFGIAKLLPSHAARAAMTEFGVRALTPDYAAPELISNGAITTATDVYSAGVVIYELLTGTRPYRLQRSSLAALEEAVLSDERIRPSRAAISDNHAAYCRSTVSKLKHELMGDLDTIVLKALKKNPDERYSTIDALHQDIERYLSDRPVLAQPDSKWYVARKFVARHRASVAIGTTMFTAIMIATSVAIYEARHAVVERDRALRLSARNETVTDFLNTLITEAAASEKPVTVTDMLKRSEALAESQYADNLDDRAAVLNLLGNYYGVTENVKHGVQLLDKAEELTRTSTDWDLRGDILCNKASFAEGDQATAKAISDLNTVVNDARTNDTVAAQCLTILSHVVGDRQDNQDNKDESLRLSLLALTHIERLPHHRADLYADVLDAVARAQFRIGKNDLADQYFDRAMQSLSSSGRQSSDQAKAIRNNWAVALIYAGDQRKAQILLDENLKIDSSSGSDLPVDIVLLSRRALVLYNLGDYAESMANSRQCIEHVAAGAIHFLAGCQLQLIYSNADAGDLLTAHRYLTDATKTIDPAFSQYSAARISLLAAQAKLALIEQRPAEALPLLDKVLTTGNQNLNHRSLLLRAEAHLMLNQLEEAQIDAQTALTLAKKLQGSVRYSNHTGLSWLMLARVQEKQNKRAEAQASLQNAILNLQNTVDSSHPALQQAQQLLQQPNTRHNQS